LALFSQFPQLLAYPAPVVGTPDVVIGIGCYSYWQCQYWPCQ